MSWRLRKPRTATATMEPISQYKQRHYCVTDRVAAYIIGIISGSAMTIKMASASLGSSKDLWSEWKVDPTDASFATVGLSAEQEEPELLQIASRAIMTTTSSTSEDPGAVQARVDELEVELRSIVLQLAQGLVQPNNEQEEQLIVSRLLRYVQSAMGLCWHLVEFHDQEGSTFFGSSSSASSSSSSSSSSLANMVALLKKVPFLLLEDMLDVVPLRWVEQRVWSQGAEPWIRGMLSHPTLLGASTKLVLIRVCNQLLKQLSLRCELAGRVMMVLAAVFPLSERSGVNVLGTVNRATPTLLETPDEYYQHNVCDEKVGGIDEVVAEIIQIQQQQQQQQQEKKQVSGDSDSVMQDNKEAEEEESKMDYDFYNVFWGLQTVFADYSSVLPSTSKASSSSGSISGDHANLWQHKLLEFISHAQQVLAAFEGHAFPPPERVSQSSKAMQTTITSTSTSTGTSTTSHAIDDSSSSSSTLSNRVGHCHKYMTNSELLHLQLKDPELRIHILTQLLIVSSHLQQSCSSSAADGASTTTTNNESVMIRSKLLHLQQRAEELLNVVPPNGRQHLRTVQWLLKERESMWKRWKKSKCKPLEKTLLTNTTSTTPNHKTKKRRLMDGHGSDSDAVVASVKRIREELPTISKEMKTKATPKLYDFLEEYVDALDPEAGIEAEYHPRNDKVFSWRALRLLRMQSSATTFGPLIRRTDGDFEAMVRHIWQHERNIAIPKAPTPPPTPEPPTPPPELEEPIVPTTHTTNNDVTIGDVDDFYGDIEMKEAPGDKDTAVMKKDKDDDEDAASVGSAFSVGSAVSGTLEEDTPPKNVDNDQKEETEMESSSIINKPALKESKAARVKEMEAMVAEEEEAEMMVIEQEPTKETIVVDDVPEKEPMTEKREKEPKVEEKAKEPKAEKKAEKKEMEPKAEGKEKEPPQDPSPEGEDGGRSNNKEQDRRRSSNHPAEGGRGGDSGHRGRGGSSSRDRDGDRRRGGGGGGSSSYSSRGGGGEREPRRGSDNRQFGRSGGGGGGGGGSHSRRRNNNRN
eukprot:scaffold42639_cov37-Attheya_sp.AAC.4